jgi:hypothetical protein
MFLRKKKGAKNYAPQEKNFYLIRLISSAAVSSATATSVCSPDARLEIAVSKISTIRGQVELNAMPGAVANASAAA